MEVILLTTDITQVPFVKMLLSSEGIQAYTFDDHMSSIEGSIDILPIRVMVLSSDVCTARNILKSNGIHVYEG